MFTKGQFLYKKDGKRISKGNKYPVVIVQDCRVNPNVEGGLIINSAMKIMPEWFDVITEEQYNAIKADPKYNNPQQAPNQTIPETKKVPFIKPGQYFRKSNWEFIGDDPVMLVKNTSENNIPTDSIYINKKLYKKNHITILTKEEYDAILLDWKNTWLSEVIDGRMETVHYREDTGEEKQARTVTEAIKYIFTYNKKNPGKNMNAYLCPFCDKIHCGKLPQPEPNVPLNLKKFTDNEELVIANSARLVQAMSKYWQEMDWEEMYRDNKHININMLGHIVATQRHFTGGWVKLFEVVPFRTKRYEMNDVLLNSWHVEGKGMRSVYVVPEKIFEDVLKTIEAENQKGLLHRLLHRLKKNWREIIFGGFKKQKQ